tara:strand:+ start:78 stop:545 length:468 start_codon:yes stop_codon:yes gene_type:complete
MQLTDNVIINTDLSTVWQYLNQADFLEACIPGCTSLVGNPEKGFAATVNQKIGPIKATFKGTVKISDVKFEQSYIIYGEGKAGAAGFAKGMAIVELYSDPNGTQLKYKVEAQVSGKIAQLGNRLIDGFAKNMAKKFFENFKVNCKNRVSFKDKSY